MEFFQTIGERFSARSFVEYTITAAEWDAMLRAAMAAPSAVNCQPWEFVLVEDRSKLGALSETHKYAKMTAEASAAVLVCAVPSRAYRNSVEFAVIDASCACENLLLAATALGLGAVWTAVYPDPVRIEAVRKILSIPEDIIPLALIPVGKPAETRKPVDRFHPEWIHREIW